jgi:hypothetical protein
VKGIQGGCHVVFGRGGVKLAVVIKRFCIIELESIGLDQPERVL